MRQFAVEGLLYRDEDLGLVPLPAWSRFLVSLGRSVATLPDCDGKVVTVITLPTRAFAASLCAVGFLVKHLSILDDCDPVEHVTMLESLPPFTTVTYRKGETGSRMVKAQLQGFKVENGKKYITLQDSKNVLTHVPSNLACQIQPSVKQLSKLPSVAKVKDSPLATPLLSALVPATPLERALARSRIECVVAGEKSTLDAELSEVTFAVKDSKRVTTGVLQDVLRVAAFSGSSFNSAIFSEVVSNQSAAQYVELPSTGAVFFDGSRSFLALNRFWPSAHWVVLLDRSGRKLDDAVAKINELYLDRRAISSGQSLPPPPPGIQLLSFYRGGTP